MTHALVPFHGTTQYPRSPTPTLPRSMQGVSITLHTDALKVIAEKMASWFGGWDNVQIVDVGVSDKVGLGFLLIEWIKCETDRFFLVVLRGEELVDDYTVSGRDLEV